MQSIAGCLLLLICLGGCFPASGSALSLSRQVEDELRILLGPASDSGQLALASERVWLHADAPEFYATRRYAPAWITDQGTVPQARVLLDALREVSAEGLCPEDYHIDLITALLTLAEDVPRHGVLFDPGWLARLDLLLTDAFLWYASDHLWGRLAFAELRERADRELEATPAALLEQALRQERLGATLTDLVPAHPGYRSLMRQLEEYRRLAGLGGWPKVPEGAKLHPGERDGRVRQLRARLRVTETVNFEGEETSDLLAGATMQALKDFQARHGLEPDGVLGPQTLVELNVPVEERIRRIELNLERWRWLPKAPTPRYLEVNIADFSLKVVEGERTVMTMPVIVGTAYRKTPVFSGTMTYLELAPYWHVPPTILREDKLPLIRKNPGWLEQKHFEIVSLKNPGEVIDPAGIDWSLVTARNFPGALRQKPGPWNALGQVKFMFPNRLSIYLHDTSERHLFQRRVRLFSSGCIRVERPMELAMYLLEPQGWTQEKLREAVSRDKPQQVSLKQPLPVRILYWTAWVDEAGSAQFRKDYYLRDLDMETALEAWRDRP